MQHSIAQVLLDASVAESTVAILTQAQPAPAARSRPEAMAGIPSITEDAVYESLMQELSAAKDEPPACLGVVP